MPITKKTGSIIVAVIAVVVAVLSVFIITAGSSTPASAAGSVRPVAVAQPTSAQSVANAVHCSHFTDLGPGHLLSSDTGSCWIGNQKYEINTFATKDARDSWLKIAATLGVSPKWETDTSVVYPSTD